MIPLPGQPHINVQVIVFTLVTPRSDGVLKHCYQLSDLLFSPHSIVGIQPMVETSVQLYLETIKYLPAYAIYTCANLGARLLFCYKNVKKKNLYPFFSLLPLSQIHLFFICRLIYLFCFSPPLLQTSLAKINQKKKI